MRERTLVVHLINSQGDRLVTQLTSDDPTVNRAVLEDAARHAADMLGSFWRPMTNQEIADYKEDKMSTDTSGT